MVNKKSSEDILKDFAACVEKENEGEELSNIKTHRVNLKYRKKPRPGEIVQTHPGDNYTEAFSVLEPYNAPGDLYLILPHIAARISNSIVKKKQLHLAINTEGEMWVWVAPKLQEGEDNSWHLSHRGATQKSKKFWIRIESCRVTKSYLVKSCRDPESMQLEPPRWPQGEELRTFIGYVSEAFEGRIIGEEGHHLIKNFTNADWDSSADE